MKIAFIAARL